MDHYLFSVRSATQAQRASRVLNSGGIHASVQRLPVEFARQGCTYAVRVDAAINSEPAGYIRYITDEIKKAIGDETEPYKASCLNVRHSVQEIEKSLCIHNIEEETGLRVVGAMYHIEDGSVEFL